MEDAISGKYGFVFTCAPCDKTIVKVLNLVETLTDQMGMKKGSCKGVMRTVVDEEGDEKVKITVITPTSRKEAKSQPEWPEWFKAETKEIDSQLRMYPGP